MESGLLTNGQIVSIMTSILILTIFPAGAEVCRVLGLSIGETSLNYTAHCKQLGDYRDLRLTKFGMDANQSGRP